MRRHFSRLALVVMVATQPGCAMTFDAHTLGMPVTMSPPGAAAPEGQHFEVSTSALYGLWGAVPISQPDLRKPLEQQLMGGKGVADLRIKVKSRWYQVLFTVITAGLLVPRTVTYEGVIVP